MMSEPAKDFIVAVRALGESCGLLYKELTEQGFTPNQAISLVQTFIRVQLERK